MRQPKYPIAYVEWLDSTSFGGWRQLEEAEEIIAASDRLHIVSIGFLFNETKEHITLIQNAGYRQVGEGITIPRCSIRRMKIIGKAHLLRSEKQ